MASAKGRRPVLSLKLSVMRFQRRVRQNRSFVFVDALNPMDLAWRSPPIIESFRSARVPYVSSVRCLRQIIL